MLRACLSLPRSSAIEPLSLSGPWWLALLESIASDTVAQKRFQKFSEMELGIFAGEIFF